MLITFCKVDAIGHIVSYFILITKEDDINELNSEATTSLNTDVNRIITK